MTTSPDWKAKAHQGVRAWWLELAEFPWRQMTGVLYRRFREARLGVSASSLTFTTVLALVPLFTVGLAVFSAFPVFGKFQDTIQRWLVDSLVPESISRQVLGYLTQFSRKASRLGSVGLVAVLFSAIALMVTIERTLGQIWRVEQPRPLQQRHSLLVGHHAGAFAAGRQHRHHLVCDHGFARGGRCAARRHALAARQL